MILLIDAGNSRLKWACLEDTVLSGFEYAEHAGPGPLMQRWQTCPPPERLICASVAGPQVQETIARAAEGLWALKAELIHSRQQALGLINAYSEPARLGVDRWLAMLAAWHQYQQALMVIDCGTAVTVDVIAADGHHLGGQIAPGRRLMMQSLERETFALANTAVQASGLADTTGAAIAAGCLKAVSAYVSSIIEQTRRVHGDQLPVLLTGGDAPSVEAQLDQSKKRALNLTPHLVLEGMALTVEHLE